MPLSADFVTAMVKGNSGSFALKGGGWYKDHYGLKSTAESSETSSATAESKDSSKTESSSSKSDSTPSKES